MSLYLLKPRFQALLRPAVAALHGAGITANQVTLAACAISLALGLGAGAEAGPQALARALSGLQLRLVIDNAEHLQAAVAELAAALLAAAPGVQLLVTSQVPLHVAGEQVLPLAPLALPDGGTDAAEPAARPAHGRWPLHRPALRRRPRRRAAAGAHAAAAAAARLPVRPRRCHHQAAPARSHTPPA